MALTYEWKVTGLKTVNVEGADNFVYQTFWSCTGTDEDGVSGMFSGATPFPVQPGDNFIPFDQLTEEIVLGWIMAVVDEQYQEHIDRQIMRQIFEKKTPPQTPDLPWGGGNIVAPPTTSTPNPTA